MWKEPVLLLPLPLCPLSYPGQWHQHPSRWSQKQPHYSGQKNIYIYTPPPIPCRQLLLLLPFPYPLALLLLSQVDTIN